jgi:hypothetical protein
MQPNVTRNYLKLNMKYYKLLGLCRLCIIHLYYRVTLRILFYFIQRHHYITLHYITQSGY